MPKNLILWLEDRPKSCDRFIKYCADQGFVVRMVANDHQFNGVLKKSLMKSALSLWISLFLA